MLHLLLFFWLAGSVSAKAAEPSGPIIRTTLEASEAVPGQPIVLRMTLLAPTWFPEPPVLPSFEVPNVIVRLPERASGPTSEDVDGETWSGVTRAYRIYPMTIGRFRIPPLPLTVTYADPENQEPVTTELQTDAILFEGIAPEGAEGLDPFIAATALTLEQSIEGETGDIPPGDAVTREVVVQIDGMSPIFLPELIPSTAAEGITAYPREPVVTESEDRGVLSGERVEIVTYVGHGGGRYTAPAVSLRWFNLDTKQIETAELPGFDITVQGDPMLAPRSAFDWRTIVLWVAGGTLVIALIGLLWKRLWPTISRWRSQRREAYLNSEAFAFAQAEKALSAHRFSEALRAIERWSWRLPTARTREEAHLSDKLVSLGAAFYGRQAGAASDQQWSEAAGALKAARRARIVAATRIKDALPPINPHLA